MSEPMKIEASEQGLEFDSSTGQGLLPWGHIHKWRSNDKLLLVYPAGNIFHPIPRHFFDSTGEYEGLIALLEERAGDAR